jgi:hypothetical protein
MRGAPQVGFSSALDRITSRSSVVILGRPRRRERKRPYQRNPARGQPTAVFGFTTTSTLAYFDQQRRRPSPKRRSQRVNRGLGFLRLRTPACCRRATSSSPGSCRERKKAPNQERKTRRNRIMGPVYMTQSAESMFVQVADFAKKSDFEAVRAP